MTWSQGSGEGINGSAAVGGGSGKSAYTCATCHAVFSDGNAQRTHYQADWHRYNLRRKVEDLPPVAEALYQDRLASLSQKATEEERAATAAASEAFECVPCRKIFSAAATFANHCKSRKHLDALRAAPCEGGNTAVVHSRRGVTVSRREGADAYLSEDATEEEVRAAIAERLAQSPRLPLEACIFCREVAATFTDSMEHMVRVHGLYIPDLEFLSDFEGLVRYLSDKVAVANCCLACPARVQPFASVEGVRRHMVDRGHLKILFDDEGMEELAEFYTYPDSDDEYEDISDDDEDDAMALSSDASAPSSYDDTLYISPDESQLILPSGKRLLNRALRHRARSESTASEEGRLSRRGQHEALIGRISDAYLAQGLVPQGEAARAAYLRKYKADQRAGDGDRKQAEVKMGERNNMMQHHFRLQLRQ